MSTFSTVSLARSSNVGGVISDKEMTDKYLRGNHQNGNSNPEAVPGVQSWLQSHKCIVARSGGKRSRLQGAPVRGSRVRTEGTE
jgi:hypothetical protein